MVLPAAGELTTSELRDFTGQAVITIDPNGAEERHQASAARRSLAIKSLPDAMATLSAFLPADGAVKIFQVSDLLATSTAASPGDNRGIAARRVDALVDIAEQLLTYGHLDLSEYLGQPLADSTTLHERASHPAADEPAQQTGDREPDVSSHDVDETVCPAEGVDADAGDLTHDVDETSFPAKGANPEPTHKSTNHSDPADTKPAPFEPVPIRVRTGGTNSVAPVGPGPVDLAESELLGNAAGATDSSVPVGTAATVPAEAADDDDRSLEASSTGAEVVVMPTFGSEGPPCRLAEPDAVTRISSEIRGTGSSVDQTRCRRAQVNAPLARLPGKADDHTSRSLSAWVLSPGSTTCPANSKGSGPFPRVLLAASPFRLQRLPPNWSTERPESPPTPGLSTYRPRQELRDQVATLNGTCRFPSCRQPVWRCDLDHREPFDHADPTAGGPTSPDNLDPYCRRHHLMKHHTDWRVRPDRESYALHFTSPTGHRYTKQQCPTAPYSVGMDNQGAAFAERLENMLATTRTESSKHSTGVIEELLTAALLRHHLTPRPIEYAPDKDFWANTDDEPIGNPPGHDAKQSRPMRIERGPTERGYERAGTADRTVESSSPADETATHLRPRMRHLRSEVPVIAPSFTDLDRAPMSHVADDARVERHRCEPSAVQLRRSSRT